MGEAVSRRRWPRNAAALVALAVLVPASAAAIGWREWVGAYDTSGQHVYAVLPAGDEDTVDLDDTTWGPVRAGVFTAADGLPVPDGAKVIAVKITVDNHDLDEPSGCGSPVLVEQSSGRQWSEMSLALDLPYDPDSPTLCSTDTSADYGVSGPYEMLVPFIVPEDAEGPFWFDVAPYDTEPSFARFSIAP